ncbi:hypothetical protein Gohar_004453 [Gossypium harknessii]|uniref:Uncharacterized protein n=1 Tax=Gossypium harknessii TaxID=34285 RepID=A0A7J9H5K7_9ROSI|nr:hypothetical protein [Gossypium harknessii]
MIVVQVDATARNSVTYIHPRVCDPFKRPSGPYSGCHPNPKGAPRQSNTYKHGCSRHRRCHQ